MSLKQMVRSKTFWTGVAAIAGSAVALYMKAITPDKAVAGIIGGLAIIFMRQGVAKSGPNGGEK